MNSQQPFMERNMAILEYGLDCDRELLAASGALPETFAGLANTLASRFDFLEGLNLWGELVGLANEAAMRAKHTVWPAHRFEVFAGLVFIRKMRF